MSKQAQVIMWHGQPAVVFQDLTFKGREGERQYFWYFEAPQRMTLNAEENPEILLDFGVVPFSDLTRKQTTDAQDKEQNAFLETVYKTFAHQFDLPRRVDFNFANDCGWISPFGVFYGCGFAGHSDLATTIADALFDGGGEDEIWDAGFVRVSDWGCKLKRLSDMGAVLHAQAPVRGFAATQ